MEMGEKGTCALKFDTSEIDLHFAGDHKWHFDVDISEGCSNSPRLPDGWDDRDEFSIFPANAARNALS